MIQGMSLPGSWVASVSKNEIFALLSQGAYTFVKRRTDASSFIVRSSERMWREESSLEREKRLWSQAERMPPEEPTASTER
jgi:hypothetical protein